MTFNAAAQIDADDTLGVSEGAVVGPFLGLGEGYPVAFYEFMVLQLSRDRRQFSGEIEVNDFIAKSRCH